MAKSVINSTLTFTPASKTIDFANVQAFDLRDVFAIVNVTAGKIIYAPGITGKGYTNLTGTVLTLQYDTTAMNAADVIAVQYDDYMLQSGVYNTTLPTVTNGQKVVCQTDSRGRQIVIATPTDGVDQTYSATVSFTAPATATDILTITGSASKAVRIAKIMVSCTQTTAGLGTFYLLKRSTANTGGTSTILTAVPHDSQNNAATAVIRAYTVNPTALGTLVGNMAIFKKEFPAPAFANSDVNPLVLVFGGNSQGITLRGTGEILCLNLNSITQTGNIIAITITWTEE
jgi:hypothetical protein